MKIYLDVDGVLLTKGGDQTKHVKSFLEKAISAHEVYWLTTHCKGDANITFNKIHSRFDPDIHPLLRTIKPTNWEALKTEAIDFNSEFLWFDDYVMQVELDQLRTHKKSNSLILVDLESDPDYLAKVLSLLK